MVMFFQVPDLKLPNTFPYQDWGLVGADSRHTRTNLGRILFLRLAGSCVPICIGTGTTRGHGPNERRISPPVSCIGFWSPTRLIAQVIRMPMPVPASVPALVLQGSSAGKISRAKPPRFIAIATMRLARARGQTDTGADIFSSARFGLGSEVSRRGVLPPLACDSNHDSS